MDLDLALETELHSAEQELTQCLSSYQASGDCSVLEGCKIIPYVMQLKRDKEESIHQVLHRLAMEFRLEKSKELAFVTVDDVELTPNHRKQKSSNPEQNKFSFTHIDSANVLETAQNLCSLTQYETSPRETVVKEQTENLEQKSSSDNPNSDSDNEVPCASNTAGNDENPGNPLDNNYSLHFPTTLVDRIAERVTEKLLENELIRKVISSTEPQSQEQIETWPAVHKNEPEINFESPPTIDTKKAPTFWESNISPQFLSTVKCKPYEMQTDCISPPSSPKLSLLKQPIITEIPPEPNTGMSFSKDHIHGSSIATQTKAHMSKNSSGETTTSNSFAVSSVLSESTNSKPQKKKTVNSKPQNKPEDLDHYGTEQENDFSALSLGEIPYGSDTTLSEGEIREPENHFPAKISEVDDITSTLDSVGQVSSHGDTEEDSWELETISATGRQM